MSEYPPTWAALLAEVPSFGLGPGTPIRAMHPRLAELSDSDLFGTSAIRDTAAAKCCRAGLWLAWNFLEESHSLSQEIATREGSYWHAIMHRREPDAWNAKYWFRKVGTHSVIDQLREQAPALGYGYTTAEAFVDFCERVRDRASDEEAAAIRVQMLEWRLLLAHCFRLACG